MPRYAEKLESLRPHIREIMLKREQIENSRIIPSDIRNLVTLEEIYEIQEDFERCLKSESEIDRIILLKRIHSLEQRFKPVLKLVEVISKIKSGLMKEGGENEQKEN